MKQPGEPNGRVLFSLVSINLWDLPIFWPRHDRTRRRLRMLERFPDLSADLLLFQEAFVQSFRERLAAALPRLNADPYLEARRRHFDLLAEAGFVEVAGGSSDGLVTMAPSVNRYARYTPWHKPDRRLTQVFYRGPGIERGPEPPTLCLHRPAVSDHFGLRVQLALARRH